MSLSEAYENITAAPRPSSCITCRWYDDLSPDDKAFFDEKAAQALRTRSWVKLYKACRASGLNVVNSSFRNHLNSHHKGEGLISA